MQAVMRAILILLETGLFQRQAEATGLSNFNLVKVEDSSLTTDHPKTKDDGSPV